MKRTRVINPTRAIEEWIITTLRHSRPRVVDNGIYKEEEDAVANPLGDRRCSLVRAW